MSELITALGLVLVIEGGLWALFPGAARNFALQAAQTPDEILRISGLIAAFCGVALIWLLRS